MLGTFIALGNLRKFFLVLLLKNNFREKNQDDFTVSKEPSVVRATILSYNSSLPSLSGPASNI